MDFKGKLVLAPLAGVADSVFRGICRSLGADITWSEMASAEGLVRDWSRNAGLIGFTAEERPYGIQLFGSDPETMAAAARLAASLGPDFIDLNFGCPVPKVVRRNSGVALMRDPGLVGRIAAVVVATACDLPVTAKIRSGWDDSHLNYLEVADELFRAGISAVTLHPRTRAQGFSGASDWSQIARLKSLSPVPVIGSGDVCEPQDALAMFEATGCDAVMVGRGALGNPWFFARARALVDGLPDPGPPAVEERFSLAAEHARMTAGLRGEARGVVAMRKHLGWYARGLPGAPALRRELFSCTSLAEVDRLLQDYQRGYQCTRTG
ncbi:MAG: tRNA dihydrouridine synthase DusB [Candidatus Glassbacteria bacterium]|nr:tRNA dihydrouridine synthase DusB [Candidatus Glassbacteria bacterium]